MARLLSGVRAKVNLIPLNQDSVLPADLVPSPPEQVAAFQQRLEEKGLLATIRRRRGRRDQRGLRPAPFAQPAAPRPGRPPPLTPTRDPAATVIQLFNLSKHYPGGQIGLHNITTSIERGEFVFLTGPSGAGKTTFLKLLYREEQPSSGSILVNGRNVSSLPAGKVPYLRRTIGVVFQSFRLIPYKTVFENIAYLPRIVGESAKEQRRMAFEILRSVGLAHRIDAYPKQLSGGEQQRVAIARAIISRPDILLGRRAHRQPRSRAFGRADQAFPQDQPRRHHGDPGHPRPRADPAGGAADPLPRVRPADQRQRSGRLAALRLPADPPRRRAPEPAAGEKDTETEPERRAKKRAKRRAEKGAPPDDETP